MSLLLQITARMEPVIVIIPPDDIWWDDLATPLVYEQLDHHFRDVYKIAMRMIHTASDASDPLYYDVDNGGGGEDDDDYTVRGRCHPIAMKSYLTSIYTGTSYTVDCTLATRGQALLNWYSAWFSQDLFVFTVVSDIIDELVRRNYAAGCYIEHSDITITMIADNHTTYRQAHPMV